MQIYLDPWNPDFAGSLQADPGSPEAPPNVQLDVERANWEAVLPTSLDARPGFVFIDGVRRVEARIILQNGRILYGLLGSAAGGAVILHKNQPNSLSETLKHHLVERYFVTGGGHLFDKPVDVHPTIRYVPISVPEEEPQAPLMKLQQLMRDAEGKIIRQIAREKPDHLLIADGPLHFPWVKGTLALGYIKSFHEWYLPSSHLPSLGELPAGARTPLFLISGTKAKFPDRYAWFIRLAGADKGDSPYSGLARLEASADIGQEKAARLANQSCALGAFVSRKYHDPRSPQNLLPIGVLEKTLKHLLGDSQLIRRFIQTWIHGQGIPKPEIE